MSQVILWESSDICKKFLRKGQILKELGLTIRDIEPNSSKKFIPKCKAASTVNAGIQIKKILLPNCVVGGNGERPTLTIVNTGNANGNCGIIEIANGFVFKDDDFEEKEQVIDKVLVLDEEKMIYFSKVLILLYYYSSVYIYKQFRFTCYSRHGLDHN